MTIPVGTDANGRPVDMVGQPITPGVGSEPALVIHKTQEVYPMPEVRKRNIYTLNGNQFYVNGNDPVPEGAEIVNVEEPAEEPVQERAKPAAPENKSRSVAPETKAKKD